VKFARAIEIANLLAEQTELEHRVHAARTKASLAVLTLDGDLRMAHASVKASAETVLAALARIEQLEVVAVAAERYADDRDPKNLAALQRALIEHRRVVAQRS